MKNFIISLWRISCGLSACFHLMWKDGHKCISLEFNHLVRTQNSPRYEHILPPDTHTQGLTWKVQLMDTPANASAAKYFTSTSASWFSCVKQGFTWPWITLVRIYCDTISYLTRIWPMLPSYNYWKRKRFSDIFTEYRKATLALKWISN